MKRILFLILIICLEGCAKEPVDLKYQKQFAGNGFTGYTDHDLGKNQFEIQVRGSLGYSNDPMMESFFNRRASELCKGKPYIQSTTWKDQGIVMEMFTAQIILNVFLRV
jgi:hypothetical protein